MANISQTLIDEAKARIADVSARMRATKEAQIAAGETLQAIKAQLHDAGEKWTGWAEANLEITTKTAFNWIKAYLKSQGTDQVEEPSETISEDNSTKSDTCDTEEIPQPSPPPAPSDEVAALQARIAELEQDIVWVREELELQYRVNKSTRKVEPLTKDEYRQLCAAFHPDVNLSPEKRTELSALWNSKASVLRP